LKTAAGTGTRAEAIDRGKAGGIGVAGFVSDLTGRWRQDRLCQMEPAMDRLPFPTKGFAAMRTIYRPLPLLVLLLPLLLSTVASSGAEEVQTDSLCKSYSDEFETFRIDRWKDVLLYSKSQANVYVREGDLVLESPRPAPCEIQIYSLFTFYGDFDVQADYTLDHADTLSGCRFNSGIVLQTLADEISYKCYISSAPGKKLFYRTRLDSYGEINLEKSKAGPAPPAGTIRVARRNGVITMSVPEGNGWRKFHTFSSASREPLRVRLKLQTTPSPDHRSNLCPVTVRYHAFRVNSCTSIVEQ
jgi:hypothetical protein